ncbi:type VI secretion system tube protein TssD [Pedobacter agri]|uniref:type VI secretion system tube protein TssD n=1 Tax=Pedobacter agri TaxID=454586 RepID=UPI00292F7E1F|nr:type VI secretion system tube protein TssD [Pedobacter agri]
MKKFFAFAICLILFTSVSNAQEESRIKITMNIMANGKTVTTGLNSVSTSISRYYEDIPTLAPTANLKDTSSTKTSLPSSNYKSGVFYLNLDAKNLPYEMLRLMAAKKSVFDGTITISDSYGKIPTRTIKFIKASLYSFSDQYSSSYYGDSIGNVAISLSCNSISINGITIEQ